MGHSGWRAAGGGWRMVSIHKWGGEDRSTSPPAPAPAPGRWRFSSTLGDACCQIERLPAYNPDRNSEFRSSCWGNCWHAQQCHYTNHAEHGEHAKRFLQPLRLHKHGCWKNTSLSNAFSWSAMQEEDDKLLLSLLFRKTFRPQTRIALWVIVRHFSGFRAPGSGEGGPFFCPVSICTVRSESG